MAVGRNVITQSSTNQIHPAEIPRTSNLYVCKFTRPSSACEGLVPRLRSRLQSADTSAATPAICNERLTDIGTRNCEASNRELQTCESSCAVNRALDQAVNQTLCTPGPLQYTLEAMS